MDELRIFIENFLNDEVTEEETADFAVELSEMLIMEESRLERENPEANTILQEGLADICDGWEAGNSIEEFKSRVREVCARAVLEY